MSTAINFAGSSGPPLWVKMLGSGILETRNDRGPYFVSNPAAIIARTREMMLGGFFPLDIEHSIDEKASIGDRSPAVGWCTDLEVRNGEIFAKIDWTTLGKSALSRGPNGSRAYNFLSPVFEYDTSTKEVTSLLRAGLTNSPNLADMSIAICSQGKTSTAEKIAALKAELDDDGGSVWGDKKSGPPWTRLSTKRGAPTTAAEAKICKLTGVAEADYIAARNRRKAREEEPAEAVKLSRS